MIEPVIIDLDAWFELLQTVGDLILEILHSIDFVVNNHTYSAFVAVLSILVTSILLYQFWGDDDE